MDTPLDHPDLVGMLTPDAYYHLIHTLRASLPPPATDLPDDVVRRDNAAIAQVASLLPVSAAEAHLAAQFVTANAQAMHCLRLSHEPAAAPDLAQARQSQASNMLRHAQGALRLLLRLQAMRQKIASDNVAVDRAAWTEHCAAGFMTQALANQAAPARTPQPAQPPAPADEPADAGQSTRDAIDAAADYVCMHPHSAAQIHGLGHLPDAPSAEVSEEAESGLVTGQAATLRLHDHAPTQSGAP